MIIQIDTDIWTTPANYARELKKSQSTIKNWIKRRSIEVLRCPEIDLVLVKRGSEVLKPVGRNWKKDDKKKHSNR